MSHRQPRIARIIALAPFRVLVLGTLLLAPSATSCGPDKPPEDASTDRDAKSDDYDPTKNIEMMAEVGALPEEEAVAAFKDSFPAIQDCFIEGARRIEFLGGDISFTVEVNHEGEAEYVYASQTTLGDRATETCMIRALKRAAWPVPVGGRVGVAENGFGFSMTGDVRPPVAWDAEQVEATLSKNATAVAECKRGTSGSFTATVYIDDDGSALSAGVSPPNKEAEAQSDCIVDVLSSASFPSPGSWPAKVTFNL